MSEFGRLLEGCLRLTCPFKWAAGDNGDPWENLLFQTKVIRPDGVPLNTGAEGCKIYAHSWTTIPESDAMWRLYGQGESVKIKTSAGALLRTVQGRFRIVANQFITFKIGAVDYLRDDQVVDSYATIERFRERLDDPHEATMLKRLAYRHEEEVRLVAYDFDDRNRRPELGDLSIRAYPENPFHLDVKIEPHSEQPWIEEVVINPKLDSEQAALLVAQVTAKGFPREQIPKSNLYGRKNITLRLPDNASAS
ncbi:MAG: DUF2971 domain-containing protein [Cephaloticoccus sp.]|nr:DUF2971 domain-containing protein [Cephaloticoccus sp.]